MQAGTVLIGAAFQQGTPTLTRVHTQLCPYLSSAKENRLGFMASFRFIGWLSQELVTDLIPKWVPFYRALKENIF